LGVQSFFDVKAQNAGPLAATGLQFVVTLPAGLQNVSASIPNGSCTVAASGVQCSLPFLKLNEVASARVSYTPAASGSVNVQATINARERDPVATNNTATATASVDIVSSDPQSSGGGSQGGGGGSVSIDLLILLAMLALQRTHRRG